MKHSNYLNVSVLRGQFRKDLPDRTRQNTEMFIYDRWIYYFRMITKATLTDLLRSLEEISRSVTDANMKLDHLIETYRYDRNTRPYDLFRDSYQM